MNNNQLPVQPTNTYRIAYLTSDDPTDKNKSSGVYYYQSKAIAKYCGTVIYLGPANNWLIRLIRKLINGFNWFLKNKINHYHSKTISALYSVIFSQKLNEIKGLDFIFADKSSCEIALLKTNVPIIYSTDATFKSLVNYYPGYKNLSRSSINSGNYIEQRAISNSAHIICASEWAARSAINDYKFNAQKIDIIPRGGNLDFVLDKETILNKKKTQYCTLLFMGKEWKRKGYEVAYQTMSYIRSTGHPVKLKVAGFYPPASLTDQDVEIISYIDKNTHEGIELFAHTMMGSDFFLLPTWAECMGIAFCEASAFGLISVTRKTGGIPDVVKEGVNGYTLDYNAGPHDFGDLIMKVYGNDDLYYKMIKSSRELFDNKLNWDHYGIELKKVLDKISLTAHK